MKAWKVILLIVAILIADQVIKIVVKTNMYYGQEINVIGDWFRVYFTENKGMAFGMELGGSTGKLLLSLFRIFAIMGLGYIINRLVKENAHFGLIASVGLIFAGAMGNILDSAFYGLIFEQSSPVLRNIAQAFPKDGGYAAFLHGNVVDMFYFPLFRFPEWVPWLGNKIFFGPIFNLADTSISLGVIQILLFQNKFFKKIKRGQVSIEPSE